MSRPAAILAVLATLAAVEPAVAAFTANAPSAGSRASAAVVFRPVAAEPPAITGHAVAGEVLTGADGVWERDPATLDRTWLRCDAAGDGCAPLAGEATLRLTAGDVGSTIRLRVRAANAGGETVATSSPTAIVTPAQTEPEVVPAPVISGLPVEGELLEATGHGDAPLGWERCAPGCVTIDGAAAPSLRLTSADVGAMIRAVADGRPSAPIGPVVARYEHTVLSARDVRAYWRLGETTGASFADLRGGPPLVLDGLGNAGAAGIDPTSAAVELAGGQLAAAPATATAVDDQFGVEAWIRPASTEDAVLVARHDAGFANGYALEIAGGRFRLRVARGGARTAAWGAAVKPGRWTYVSGQHSGSTMRVFTDGVEGAGTSAPRPGAPSAPVRIGPLHGTVDEVAVYGRNLTASAVAARWEVLRANSG